MTDDIKHSLCFSGHRPEKLPAGGDENAPVTKVLKSLLYQKITDSIDKGFTRFYIGGARGVDMWAGEILMEQKSLGKNIEIIVVLPYEGFNSSFKGCDKWIFGRLIYRADKFITLSAKYYNGCMLRRNEYMVNHSSALIAVLCDPKSGTGHTVNTARRKGLTVDIINAADIAAAMDKSADEYEVL